MIEIVDLHKSFGETRVLQGIDLSIQAGEVIVMIGPSGGGKSTLLRCINGLEPFQRGQVRVDEMRFGPEVFGDRRFWEKIRPVRLRVGMVFQSFNLFPHLTALQNVTLGPLKVLGKEAASAEAEGREWLRRVHLQGKEHQYPRSLSGGEQQRVAIARALAMNLDTLLFDEPTSSLDPERVGEVLEVISELASEGYTLLIVTHQMHFARHSADRIVFLDQGQLLETGPADQFFEQPRSPRVRAFLGKLAGGG